MITVKDVLQILMVLGGVGMACLSVIFNQFLSSSVELIGVTAGMSVCVIGVIIMSLDKE